MELSEILNLILGGGLIVTLVTLRATVRRANAEAKKANAEADTVQISNTEQATRILVENIVEPLKKELSATREELADTKKEMASTKREVVKLRKAVNDANGCKHHNDCPVLNGLREYKKDVRNGEPLRNGGQHYNRDKTSGTGKDTDERGTDGDTDGQPP